MIVHRKDDSDEDSDEELPPLHERLQWNKDSDDEENSEEIERNRMSYNEKFKKIKIKDMKEIINITTMIRKDYFQELLNSPQRS